MNRTKNDRRGRRLRRRAPRPTVGGLQITHGIRDEVYTLGTDVARPGTGDWSALTVARHKGGIIYIEESHVIRDPKEFAAKLAEVQALYNLPPGDPELQPLRVNRIKIDRMALVGLSLPFPGIFDEFLAELRAYGNH